MKSVFKFLCIFSFVTLVVSCASNKKTETAEEEQPKLPLLESMTYEGYKEYSLKYDDKDRVIEYNDNNLHCVFEISYDPVKIKISYFTIDENGDMKVNAVQDIYDAVLNNAGFITAYKTQYATGDMDPTVKYGSVELTYNSDNRLTEMRYSSGDTIGLEWDKDGGLSKVCTPEYDMTYTHSETPNKSNQWNPLWYVCAGLEMTGLIGNPPSVLVDSGVQTFKNGVNSTANFEYKLKENKLINEIIFREDDFEPKVYMVNYKD